MNCAEAAPGPVARPGLSRRGALCLLAAAASAPIVAAPSALPGRGVDVTAQGADASGRRDSSAAFRAAFARSTDIRVPAGTYLVGDVELPDGASITGVGESSILKQIPGARFVLTADSGSADAASNLRAIRLANLQLRGSCDSEGFSQFIHLVSLNGVTDATIDGVVFRGFRGDGLYIGSGNIGGQERHNARVAVRRSTFDGLDRQNRNGISVIDCDGLAIEDCSFMNTTRSDMPGAIDLEPDGESFQRVRNVRIARNTFTGVGGLGAVISVYVPRNVLAMPTGIVIEDNTIFDVQANAFRFEQPSRPRQATATPQCIFRGNSVKRCAQRPFLLRGVTGAVLSGNHFDDTAQAAQIGFERSQDAVQDIALSDNVFTRCGSGEDSSVQVFSATDVRFEHNQWFDCGNGTRASSAVRLADGGSRRVSFIANSFASPTHKTTWAVSAASGHPFASDGNLFARDNRQMDGLLNAFDGVVR
jgi:hypothetical protein